MARNGDVTVLPDAAALAQAAAERVVIVLARALSRAGNAHIALAGGSTPRAVNALLTADPLRGAVDWRRVVFWFGDERCVPPDDDESNYKMNRETLLDPLGISAAHVRRMRGEDEPHIAAAAYDALLQQELGELPRLDLIQLGMGPDGHTASLFPGTLDTIESAKRCVANFVPKFDRWRLTLTPRTINAAHEVIFTAGGGEKADALRAVLDGPEQPGLYPSQIVHPADGELRWLVDAAAASKL
jgi:6-phosphogluconolactonase